MVLRSTRSLAVHLQQHHVDPAWQLAARQVADDCSKYEHYVSGNRALARRLHTLQDSLQLQQLGHGSKADAPRTPGLSKSGSASILTLEQQLQLCRGLLSNLQSGSVDDSMQWLAALELPDAALQHMQQLQEQERLLVAAVDSLISQPGEAGCCRGF